MHARVNRELTRGQHRRLDGCSLRQTGCVVWDRRYLGGVSVERTVTCQDCAEPRSGVEQFDDASRPSCPRCGGTKIAVSLTITASVAFATARAGVPELSLSHSADAHARLRHLQYATNSLPDLDNSDDLDVATRHVGMALERIHELDDARRRGEWLYPSWAAADRELWKRFWVRVTVLTTRTGRQSSGAAGLARAARSGSPTSPGSIGGRSAARTLSA